MRSSLCQYNRDPWMGRGDARLEWRLAKKKES